MARPSWLLLQDSLVAWLKVGHDMLAMLVGLVDYWLIDGLEVVVGCRPG